MPTLQEARDKADNWLAARYPNLVSKQDNFFSTNGHYWQGLVTHTLNNVPNHTPSADGDSLADRGDDAPSDISENWNVAFPNLLNLPIPAAIWIDAYNGPLGQGYIINVLVRFQGTWYHRSRNEGPETWRTIAWHVEDDLT